MASGCLPDGTRRRNRRRINGNVKCFGRALIPLHYLFRGGSHAQKHNGHRNAFFSSCLELDRMQPRFTVFGKEQSRQRRPSNVQSVDIPASPRLFRANAARRISVCTTARRILHRDCRGIGSSDGGKFRSGRVRRKQGSAIPLTAGCGCTGRHTSHGSQVSRAFQGSFQKLSVQSVEAGRRFLVAAYEYRSLTSIDVFPKNFWLCAPRRRGCPRAPETLQP